MRFLLNHLGNDYRKALAAYNYGIGNVRHAVERLGGLWETALPTETARYLAQIVGVS